MHFKVKPMQHQLDVFKNSLDFKEYALFWEVGTGKTYGIINIIRGKFYQASRMKRTIIFAPISTLYSWKKEWETFSTIPSNKIEVVTGSGKKRVANIKRFCFDQQTLKEREKILIMNYEALINPDVFNILLAWQPEVLICDESHMLKSGKARRTKAVVNLSKQIRKQDGNIFLLTGTPILNTPMDIFWQFLILDGGDTFGKNFMAFRDKYFRDINAPFAGKKGYFPKWEVNQNRMAELTDMIYKKASRVTKEECLDLPPLVKILRHTEMGPEQKKLYKEMEKDFITYINHQEEITPIIAEFAMTKALRLMQICSGFVKDVEGREIVLDKVPKLEVLKELLEEITPDHKVIIWCSFKQNYKMIASTCEKLKLQYVMLTGQQSVNEKQESIEQFQGCKDVKVMIANRRAGGTGVTLTAASYSIIYSRDVSLGNEIQAEARNYRKGSEIHEKVTKIDLVTPNTVEEKVLQALGSKKKIADFIIDSYKEN